MSTLVPFASRLLGLVAMVAFVAACASYPPIVGAQGNVGTNIPVLVMGEDEDPYSVKRSSDIFKRVLAELKGSMQNHGFRMIDEESVAVDLGWKLTERRPKTELLQAVKLLTDSDKAQHRVRTWVLFRIHAQAKKLENSFAVKVQTRIDGEIYDAASNELVGTFEMPRETYGAPSDCLESKICIAEVVGDRAREIASGLGEVLARKLEPYSPPRSGAREFGQGRATPYTLTLRKFDDVEALTIVSTMAEEFPGFMSMDLLKKTPTVRSYRYQTTAKEYKLEEWLYILLRDMGFNTKKEVLIQVRGTDIQIDRLYKTRRPVSADEAKRFK